MWATVDTIRTTHSLEWREPHNSIQVTMAMIYYRLTIKLKTWKQNMEAKWLRVNMGKTKFLVSNRKFTINRERGSNHCSVCLKGVDKPAIFCVTCEYWVHVNGRCGDVKRSDLKEGSPHYSCKVCTWAHRRQSVQKPIWDCRYFLVFRGHNWSRWESEG